MRDDHNPNFGEKDWWDNMSLYGFPREMHFLTTSLRISLGRDSETRGETSSHMETIKSIFSHTLYFMINTLRKS